MKDAIALYKQR